MLKSFLLVAAALGLSGPLSAQSITWAPGPRLTPAEGAQILATCRCGSNYTPSVPPGTLQGVSGGGGTLTAQATTFWAAVPMALPLRLDGTPRYHPYEGAVFYAPAILPTGGGDRRRHEGAHDSTRGRRD